MNVEKSAQLSLFLSSFNKYLLSTYSGNYLKIKKKVFAQRILGPRESDNQKSHKHKTITVD